MIQCRIEDGLLLFITEIPEMAVEEPQERDGPVLQESSNGEQTAHEGSPGLKSVLSAGKNQNSGPESGERLVVTFSKENIKPREPSRNHHLKESGKEKRDFGKGNGAPSRSDQKKDKKKNEAKKSCHERTMDSGKQVTDTRNVHIHP